MTPADAFAAFTMIDWTIIGLGILAVIVIPGLVIAALVALPVWLVRRFGILPTSPAAEAVPVLAAPAEPHRLHVNPFNEGI
ncbi:hypothetical protein LXJ59_26665 [Escherichia coli]|nr:hypothetical protein [Escherichia coli]